MTLAQSATVFVSIASYRDRECSATLMDLFAKAAFPERISVGLLWQIDPEQDGAVYTEIPCRAGQVRAEVVVASLSRGPCWARHWIQNRFFQGEAFYLQIDSHTRFVPAWDEQLIRIWQQCPSHKPVLSTLPPPYHPPDERIATGLTFIRAERFKSDGNLVQRSGTMDPGLPLVAPRPGAFLSAAFIFAAGSMVREVPYDPHLYFYGEELTLAARLWTHAYDMFVPNAILLYHNYGLQERARHWDDHPEEWLRLQKLSQERRLHLLEMQRSSDPQVIVEMDSYALGVERSLAEYERYADIDLQRRKVGVRALDGQFPLPAKLSESREECRKIFSEIYHFAHWGDRETRSGYDSLWRKSKTVRRELQQISRRLTLRTLLDAGCGDGNWLAWMGDCWDLYLGVDVVAELIANNQTLFAHRPHHLFKVADICHDPLPRMDAILCRNVLNWLPLAQAAQALQQCKRSESRYLLATTHPGASNRPGTTGQWRRLDLTAPPFSLPPPLQLLADGPDEEGRYLGVWRLADVALPPLLQVLPLPDQQQWFAPLREEWQLWQQAGLNCSLWWRDDDLMAMSANFRRLQQLAEQYRIPVLLAVIPGLLAERLAEESREASHLYFCQHGFLHHNYQPAGKSQSEFGSARSAQQVCDDVTHGFARMRQLFGARFLPIFVPPWNNFAEEHLSCLQRSGLQGLSQYGPLPHDGHAIAGVIRYNAHVDVIDWSRTPPRLLRSDWLVERLVSKLRQRRLGELHQDEPLGILTHHRVMDQHGWRFMEQLFLCSRSFPGVRWLAPTQLFGMGKGEENGSSG
ncbi:MAG: methyltransferase domain-containing protein [Magnetococcales bacterium]|nr:methyltransferase domain-containing protein [Magnetococcales bacterium]